MVILVVVAHPDDEVLGCGGSVTKWSLAGHDVHVLFMSDGVSSRFPGKDYRTQSGKHIQNRKNDAMRAGQILGTKSTRFLDFPDNRMDSLELLEVVRPIETAISELKPYLIVTHHGGDLNIDHRITNSAVMTACRPLPNYCVRRILAIETPSSTEWQSPESETSFRPNWHEDISTTLETKIAALTTYQEEMRDWPHSRSIDTVRHLAHWRGSAVGCEAAEAFVLLRNIEGAAPDRLA